MRFLHHKHGKTLRVKHTGAAGGALVQRIVFFFVVGLGFFHILQRYLKQLAALQNNLQVHIFAVGLKIHGGILSGGAFHHIHINILALDLGAAHGQIVQPVFHDPFNAGI